MPIDASIFKTIEADLRDMEIDEIKKRLDQSMIGITIESPIYDPGTFLYRARQLGPSFVKSAGVKLGDLIYPPANSAKLGRLNREQQSIFYCSMHKESVFFELPDLKKDDELLVTFWKTTAKMIVNNIGYTDFVFKELGAKRAVPQWRNEMNPADNKQTISPPEFPKGAIDKILGEGEARAIRETLSKYFMRRVEPTETYNYKLTTAIGELHLGKIINGGFKFAGILYPSVRMWGNGDNIALLPWFVDECLEFRKAVHVRIDDRSGEKFSITYLDVARTFDGDGNLFWTGPPRWVLDKPFQKAQFKFEAGSDEDGDYSISANGEPAHWVAYDLSDGSIIPFAQTKT